MHKNTNVEKGKNRIVVEALNSLTLPKKQSRLFLQLFHLSCISKFVWISVVKLLESRAAGFQMKPLGAQAENL